MIKVEVTEGECEIVTIVGCSLGKTSRYEFVVVQPTVMINVHMLDDLPQITEFLSLLRGHIGRELLNCQKAILVLVDLHEDLT